MREIIDYKIIQSHRSDYFQNQVLEEIKSGYQPFGSVATSTLSNTLRYCQAMVKYKDKEIIQTGPK